MKRISNMSWIVVSLWSLTLMCTASPAPLIVGERSFLPRTEGEEAYQATLVRTLQMPATERIAFGSPVPAGGHISDLIATFEREIRGPQRVKYTENFRYGNDLCVSNRLRNPLDTPACSLFFGATDTFSYFPGFVAGDGYKVWVNPAQCTGCTNPYLFRVDSLCFQLVQDDGSPRDTVYLGVDIECAAFDPEDSCQGPGSERCFEIWRVILPPDTANGFLTLYNLCLPLDSCWVDGPFFAGLFFLGNSVQDTFFKPTFRLDGGRTPVVPACNAWSNIGGGWETWPAVWADPDPGYPVLSVRGECADPAGIPPAPCPELCSQQRISAPVAFYDPTTTAVWQYYASGSNLSFPYDPEVLQFSIYYYDSGLATDSVTLRISYGCPRFDDVCCAPSDEVCAGVITIARGETSIGNDTTTLVPVSLDLSQFPCCLPENFWVGVSIVGVNNGLVPSFLFSNRNNEVPPPPDCEQWLFSDGEYVHLPQGNLGWWDAVLAGNCGSCGSNPDTTCPPIPTEVLDCSGATPITCNATGVTLTNQTTVGGGDNVNEYCCTPWPETGPEKVYSISVPNNGNLSVSLTNMTADLDVVLLSDCLPRECILAGDNGFVASGLAAGTYYIVIEGFNGAQGNFDITVTCFASCPGQVCQGNLRPGNPSTSSRYLDGEWGYSNRDTVYYAYYPGSGSTQYILKWHAAACDTFRRIAWTSAQATANRVLAFDPRSGGQFWTSTFISGSGGRLYRVSATGTVLNTFTAIAGIDSLRFSGAAFDPNHNHLWLFKRGTTLYSPNYAYELDVSNPASPVLIQGPHLLNFQYPDSIASSGGADYAEFVNKILVAAQGTPLDFVQCFNDVNPGYAGPPPGPGLMPDTWCPPDSNSFQGFGLAVVDIGGTGSGQMHMTNFTDGSFQPHKVYKYSTPCVLSRCDSVTNLTVIRPGLLNQVDVSWTGVASGNYQVWSTTSTSAVFPTGWNLDAIVPSAAGPITWSDTRAFMPFRRYLVIHNCQ